MSRKGVDIIILCEDQQHANFVRQFLYAQGFEYYDVRPIFCPPGEKSGEQFIREEFPKQLTEWRRAQSKKAMIVMTDADNTSVDERIRLLKQECNKKGIEFRKDNDRVVFAIPKRNIETWIRYLDGEDIDENVNYKKPASRRNCKSQSKKLWEMCLSKKLNDQFPDSLKKHAWNIVRSSNNSATRYAWNSNNQGAIIWQTTLATSGR